MRNFKFPTFLLKVLVSVGLITFFLSRIDLSQVLIAISKTHVRFLLIGLVLYPLAQIISAVKWQYLAKALGINKELKPMVGLYFIGMFFNLFLPTSIGGDITRGLYLNPDSGKTRSSFLSVLLERGSGLLGLVLLASTVMLTPYGAALPAVLRYGFPAATVLAIFILSILPWIFGKTRTRIRQLIWEDLIVFWKEPRITGVAILYSILFHSILVAIHVCIAKALSLNIPVPYHFITLALASLASLLPSFNGIGVRDAAYIYLLSLIGIDKAYGLLFSILWFSIMAISGFIGCIVFLIRGLTPAPTTKMADQH